MPISPSPQPNDYFVQVSRGLFVGEKFFSIFGYDENVNGTETVVWTPSSVFTRPTTAETVNVVSTSTNDTSLGSGANLVVLIGVDDNYDEAIDVISMNGTTNVLSTLSFREINRVAVLTAGNDDLGADGDITVTRSGDAVLLAEMKAGENLNNQAMVTIPNGRRGAMTQLSVFKQGRGAVEVSLYTTGITGDPPEPTPRILFDRFWMDEQDHVFINLGVAPVQIPGGSQLRVHARTVDTGNVNRVSVRAPILTAPDDRFINPTVQV